MKYLSTKEVSIKWNIDQSLVLRLLKNGRIEGAIKIGNNWAIPFDAKKPIDKRTKKSKEEIFFRFPLYANFEEDKYYPPLTDDERKLRKAQVSFYGCRFNESKSILDELLNSTKNRYIYIAAFYYRCKILRLLCSEDYYKELHKIDEMMLENFPYKKEMMIFRDIYYIDSTYYKTLIEDFSIDSNYSYHPSCYYALYLICLIPIENGDFSILSKIRFDTYELMCQQMEKDGYFIEAQKLHYLLLIVYQLQTNKEKMLFHTKKGLDIAYKYNLIIIAASYSQYYPDIFNECLKDFPKEFIEQINEVGEIYKKSEKYFMLSSDNPLYMEILSGPENELAFLVNQGYSNKEIAGKLGISEKLVSKRYTQIYDKLNVKNKQELIDLINNTHRNG